MLYGHLRDAVSILTPAVVSLLDDPGLSVCLVGCVPVCNKYFRMPKHPHSLLIPGKVVHKAGHKISTDLDLVAPCCASRK